MRHAYLLLATLCLTSSVLIGQTGFTSQSSNVNANTAMRSADFNGDGYPDLLFYGGTATASIGFNLGNGTFGTPTRWGSSEPLSVVQIGDFNGDGKPDLAGCDAGNLEVYLATGPAQFNTPTPVNLYYGCNSVNLGDVNGDGNLDIIVTGTTGGGAANRGATPNNAIQVFFGDGKGNFTAGPLAQNINLDSTKGTAGITQCALTDAVSGDFLGNGTVSIVVDAECFPASPGNPYPSDTNSTVFLGKSDPSGNFTFTELTESGYYYTLQNTESNSPRADLNHDGRPDLLFSTSNGTIVTGLNNGGGNFTFVTPSTTYQSSDTVGPFAYGGVAAGDFNADGIVDLATAFNGDLTAPSNGPGEILQDNFLSILYGQPSGSYSGTNPAVYGDGYSGDVPTVLVGDFNRDGLDDFALLSFNNPQNQYILTVYTNTQTPSTTCNTPTQSNANIICRPTTSQTENSPVTVTAASNVAGFTVNRLYLDNVSVYQVASQQVNTSITAAAGTHTLVLVSYNNKGQAFTSSVTFTVAGTNPAGCLPANAGVVICSPVQNATSNNPVTFTAGATPPANAGGITALRVYIDNSSIFSVNNPNPTTNPSFQTSQSAAIAPGKHSITVVAYLGSGAALTASESFTVAGTMPCYPATAGAMICSPTSGATTTSPFTLTAGATAGSGTLTAIRVYSDNVAVTLVSNPSQTKSFAINPQISLASGKHNLVIVGYTSTGSAVTASETVTVP